MVVRLRAHHPIFDPDAQTRREPAEGESRTPGLKFRDPISKEVGSFLMPTEKSKTGLFFLIEG
jgi:hypothetical protein